MRPIRNDFELDIASEIFSELGLKSEHRNRGEEDYLTVLGKLIQEYEACLRPLAPHMTPQRALESLMQDNKLSQSELSRQIEVTQSVISDFLRGRHELSKIVIIKLADYFKVSPSLFLPKAAKALVRRRSASTNS